MSCTPHRVAQVPLVLVISWSSHDERIFSTLSPPFPSFNSSLHSSSISCTSFCTFSTTLKAEATLRISTYFLTNEKAPLALSSSASKTPEKTRQESQSCLSARAEMYDKTVRPVVCRDTHKSRALNVQRDWHRIQNSRIATFCCEISWQWLCQWVRDADREPLSSTRFSSRSTTK